MLQTKRVTTLEQVRQVVQGIVSIECRSMDRASAYAFMLDTLVRLHFRNCSRPDKGLPRSYMARLTGFSRSQLTRLIAQYMDHGRIADRRQRGPVRAFPRCYTDQDMRLLARVDESLGQGPARPNFRYDRSNLDDRDLEFWVSSERLAGCFEALSMTSKKDALINLMPSEAIKTSAIEGENLDRDAVRPSLLHELGIIDISVFTKPSQFSMKFNNRTNYQQGRWLGRGLFDQGWQS